MKWSAKQPKIFHAVFKGNVSSLKKLLASKENVDPRDSDNRTPLTHSVIDGQMQIIRLLIRHHADVNAVDALGMTPLQYAVREGHRQIVPLLITAGANVNTADVNGNTPLCDAVFYSEGKGDIISMLLDAGADKSVKNKHRVSASSLAKNMGIERLLVRSNKKQRAARKT